MHFIYSSRTKYFFHAMSRKYYTQLFKRSFAAFGEGSTIGSMEVLLNPKYVSLGKQTYLGDKLTLRCYDRIHDSCFSPSVSIGNCVSIGADSQITSINSITIGNGVMTGRFLLITDNAHGYTDTIQALDMPVFDRPVVSKGKVVIEDNVWIGDKVSILPNVHIGKGAIIGANSVVTRDIPDFAIACGNPAKIKKQVSNPEVSR